jgi:hypothetical protein
MHACVAVGAAILLAVVWWDLVFDSQVQRHPAGVLPPEVLASLSGYYRRCTVEGAPLMYLPVAVMVLVLAGIATELWKGWGLAWAGWASLAVAAAGVVTVAFLAVPRARRIGRATEGAEALSGLARTVFRLHLLAASCWAGVIVLQLGAR